MEFEYNTPKIISINNKTVAIFNRVVQFAIVSYIIGYAIIWNKGYQTFCEIESSVTSKVKGVAYTNFSKDQFNPLIPNIDIYRRVWDTADYIVPASENNAFFITTNIVITSHQMQGKCPEDPDVHGALCNSDTNCTTGNYVITGHGVFTGKCIQSDINVKLSVCEVYGWCPVERDVNPLIGDRALLTDTKKFTVLIKNFVEFPKFSIKRKNIPDMKNPTDLKHCTYHPENNPLCPIFILKDIVPGDYDEISLKGGAVAIIIKWDCNFDYDESTCFPTYSFQRLDKHDLISTGLNFRYAHYYNDSVRTLYKAYGIKFHIMAQGRGGQFSIVPLLLNLGSGLALLAIATVISDIVVLYLLEKRDFYKAMIYESISDYSFNNNRTSALGSQVSGITYRQPSNK